ncbi:MAG: NUDIX hydrolase [Minisyncoccia bacterium]
MNIDRPKSRQPIPEHAKRVFTGVVFDVYQWEQRLYDSSIKTFEKVKRDDTIVVIPTLSDKRFIMEIDEQPSRTPIRTFPAGRMDHAGENDPLETAKRELLEETGYESSEWSLWRSFQPVTKVDWAVYIFVAKNCQKTSEPDPGPGEKITVELKTFDEVIELAKDSDFVADDIRADLIESKYNPVTRKDLEKIFFG